MRIDARELSDFMHWRVYDALQDNAMLSDVVWLDDTTHMYGAWSSARKWFGFGIDVIDAPQIIISVGLRMAWVNVRPEQVLEHMQGRQPIGADQS